MKPIFLDVAQSDFGEAMGYYDEQSFGLGFELAEAVERALERIEHYPEAWSPLSSRVRRCLVRRFPYGVIYETRSDRLIIVAIQKLHREPESWRSRVKRPVPLMS
ncbi:MAG: type II toxin-antitoxin system RelE/ParE family toxin [Pyrinomonadaceae bacterium]